MKLLGQATYIIIPLLCRTLISFIPLSFHLIHLAILLILHLLFQIVGVGNFVDKAVDEG